MSIKISEPDLGRSETKNFDNNLFEKDIIPTSEPVQSKTIIQPTPEEMQAYITELEKIIAKTERALDDIVTKKNRAIIDDSANFDQIDKLYQAEKKMREELTQCSAKLADVKNKLSWALQDTENAALAKAAIKKYGVDAQGRAEVGQAIINSLIKVIDAVAETTLPVKNFTALQEKTYSQKFAFIKDMRVWGLTNIQTETGEVIGIENIQNDTSLLMRETKDKLRLKLHELDKAQNILDAIRWDVLRAISFENFNRMERPEGLPNY